MISPPPVHAPLCSDRPRSLLRIWLRHGCGAAPLLASLAVSQPAAADVGSIEEQLHLQLQLSVVDHRKLSGSLALDSRDDYDFMLKQTQYGIASGLALGLGYGLTEHLELHLRGALSVRRESSTLKASEDEEVASAHDKVRSIELLPSLRYVGDEGERRFFAGAGLGYEGSKRSSGGGREGSVKAFVMSAQAGFYCFLHEHVSIDPGLELSFIRGSVKLPGAEEQQDESLSGRGKGLRVLVTIGLSAWPSGDDDGASDAAGDGSEPTYAQEEPSAELRGTKLAAVQLEGLTLELLGDPARSRTELQLLVTKHEEGVPPCSVVLLSDHPPEPLEPAWYANGADEVGALVSGLAKVTVGQMEHWLAKNPSLSVCGRAQLVGPELRAELEAGLTRFKEAGTAATQVATPDTRDDAADEAHAPGF